jgi:hypothetical protein
MHMGGNTMAAEMHTERKLGRMLAADERRLLGTSRIIAERLYLVTRDAAGALLSIRGEAAPAKAAQPRGHATGSKIEMTAASAEIKPKPTDRSLR